jgi:hypothetical protein
MLHSNLFVFYDSSAYFYPGLKKGLIKELSGSQVEME